MENANPYEAPEAENIIASVDSGDFSHLNFKQLKKLYNRSHNVSSIAGLIILGAIIFVGISVVSFDKEPSLAAMYIGIAVVYVIASIGLIQRTSWGRVMGIIICCLMLLSIPIGTLIGLAGLFAFFKSPELFGTNRVLHKDLKLEVKHRKQNKLTK
jgi:hypothetical protein